MTGIRTPICYHGGKQLLLKQILPYIENNNSKLYVEPFVGGGAVFFGKNKKFETEVLNDINSNVMTFYKVLKSRHSDLLSNIEMYGIKCEKHFRKCKEIFGNNDDTICEVERAGAFYYLMIHSFASNLLNFGYLKNKADKINRENKRKNQRLIAACEKLNGVQVFNRCALDIIAKFDCPETIFYLDPPYINTDCKHYKGYTEDDYRTLLTILANTKAKYVLSSYKNEILEQFINTVGNEHINITYINTKSQIRSKDFTFSKRVETITTNIVPHQTQLF